MESEVPERLSMHLIEHQVTNETLEFIQGFVGVAHCSLHENITKHIVDIPVPEGLTEYVEVVKVTLHERVQQRFHVDLLVPHELAKEIREVIMDMSHLP